jgi:cytoplasmic iron level regulating protein YaaA (DUF328/UPF0246 family)
MLFLLSPAKSLDYETAAPAVLAALPFTPPLFVKHSKELIDVLRGYAPPQIAELMDLSDNLSALNVARYKAWSSRATVKNARPALLAFDGDVYGGLDAYSLSADDFAWTQDHVCMLSGLYGVLRPLDLMQPYRLEMGTRLANPGGKDLYQFWGAKIADYLNQRLRNDLSPVVVNLASQEYFKAVDTRALRARVIECVFEENKSRQYKVISFFAKRARGLMARFAATHRLVTPEQLRAFDVEGYVWNAKASTPERIVFRRKI